MMQAHRIDVGRKQAGREQGLRIRRKVKTLRRKRIVQRLNPHAITRQKQVLPLRIPDGKRKHTVQFFDTVCGLCFQKTDREDGFKIRYDTVKGVLDEGSELFEIGLPAGLDLEYGSVPCAGTVTGIGQIHGVDVMLVANDATVKGGTSYPITVTKSLRAQVRN